MITIPLALAAAPASKDTLRVVTNADPAHLDPNASDDQQHFQVTRQICETLFVYNDKYEIAPWLCEKYERPNPTTIILHIRKGVKFHNGDTLKASDVLFTFQRIVKDKLDGLTEIQKVDIGQCKVLDDYTLKLVTKGPAPTQIALLEGPDSAILSERAYKEANGNFLKGACVGTGPYQLVSYTSGDQVVMKKFDGYWRKGEPHIANVIFRFITDTASRAIEAETGGADIVYYIGPKDVAAVNSTKGVKVVSDLGANTVYLLLNTQLKPLDNLKVRQAIWTGLDYRAAVIAAYGKTFGAVASGWVCPGIKGYDADVMAKFVPKRDPQKAKQLLAEAGYPNGVQVHIAVPASSQERRDMAEVFQAQLGEAGFDVKVDVLEDNNFSAQGFAGKFNMCIYGQTASDFEADRSLVQFLPGTVGFKLCAFGNQKFVDSVNKAVLTMDDKARADLYKQAINTMMENCVSLPLWHKALNAAVSDGVGGFKITRTYEHHYLQYVYFK
ncbi:MAG: ABC transporter substrate-binding protein [Holophaga sp.]